MKKLLKLDTIDAMHKQLELPNGKYGVVIDIVNVSSMYDPDSFPLELYKNLKAGKIEINTIRYSDGEKIDDSIVIDTTNIEVVAYQLEKTNLASVAGIVPVDGYKPYALVTILDDYNLDTYKVDNISLVTINGVLKADVVISSVLPMDNIPSDDVNALLFKLSYIPYTDYINNNYCIINNQDSLDSILATYTLLSNRHDIKDITVIDVNTTIPECNDKTIIIIDINGRVSINGADYINMLDMIKNMCKVFNIDFTATDLMNEIDAIIKNDDKQHINIRKLLLDTISTLEGKTGFIENTIPLIATGMYKTFTNFFSNELVELNIKKKLAKEILDKAQIAHSNSYTVTIISSNILIDEIIESIGDRELENSTNEHIYAILSNHTEYTDLISICFNNTELLDVFETNIPDDFGNIIGIPIIVDLANHTADILRKNTKLTDYGVNSYTLNPMYCN